MTPIFAIEGCEASLRQGVLELQIAGDRGPGTELPVMRFIQLMMSKHGVHGFLCDFRDAEYSMPDVELEMRGRGYARIFAGLPVAVLIREDQSEKLVMLRSACEAQNCEFRRFKLLAEARQWLHARIAQSEIRP